MDTGQSLVGHHQLIHVERKIVFNLSVLLFHRGVADWMKVSNCGKNPRFHLTGPSRDSINIEAETRALRPSDSIDCDRTMAREDSSNGEIKILLTIGI